MAEHYGVKPKIFTREWWPYFWMYYKVHTVAVVFAAILMAITIEQCATKEKYDLNVIYTGSELFQQETLDKLEYAFESVAEDTDGNGDVNVLVYQINIGGESDSASVAYTLQSKHDMEFSEDMSNIFLYDEAELELVLGREQASDLYMDVREWAGTDISQDKLVYTSDGIPRAMKLEESSFLDNIGMNSSDLYIAVKADFSDSETGHASHRSAINAANLILK